MKSDPKPDYAGIYVIRHIESGRAYVGSAANIYSRFRTHKSNLRRNLHHCQYLQNSWNKHGESLFVFEVVEQCLGDVVILRHREEAWMARFDGNLFNASPHAEASFKKPMSEEAKAIASERMMGNKCGEGTHYHGDLTTDDVVKILYRFASGDPVREIAKDFDVSDATVSRIGSRKTWWRVEIPDNVEASRARRCTLKRQEFRGEGSPKSKLTWDDIGQIRERSTSGESLDSLAKDFGVTGAAIRAIVLNIVWNKKPEVFERFEPPVKESVQIQPLPPKPKTPKKKPLDPRRNRKVERISVNCGACGAEMKVPPCRVRITNAVYCSKDCKKIGFSARVKKSMEDPGRRKHLADMNRGKKHSLETREKMSRSQQARHSKLDSPTPTLSFPEEESPRPEGYLF